MPSYLKRKVSAQFFVSFTSVENNFGMQIIIWSEFAKIMFM